MKKISANIIKLTLSSSLLCVIGCGIQIPDVDFDDHVNQPQSLPSSEQNANNEQKTNHSSSPATESGMGEIYYQLGKGETDLSQAHQWFIKAAEQGDPHAYLRLGHMYFNAQGVEADFVQAAKWYRMAAATGLPNAQLKMGELYRDGLGVPQDLDTSVKWYEKAAEQGDTKAMLALANLYKGWHNMTPDYDKALSWLRQAASLGSEEGEFQMGWLLARGAQGTSSKGYSDAVLALEKSAKKNHPGALSELGDIYFEGRTGVHDMRLATDYYQRASNFGSSEAAFKLGMIYSIGNGVDKDPKQAVEYILRAANLGMPQAQYQYGKLLHKGYGETQKNLKLAREWYLKSAEQNYGPAAAKLGDMSLSGKGAPRYYPDAYKWYLKAGYMHDTYAYYMLSIMYQEGIGISPDLEASMKWLRLAYSQHDRILAQYQVGRNYETGYPLKRDRQEAIRWYQRAAELGDAKSQNALGDIYSSGAPEQRDNILAVEWYQKAAEQGHAYGQYNLGLMILQGLGVEKNPKHAASWLTKASHNGHRAAQYQLGLLYFEGNGVAQDDAKAYGWLTISLQDNNEATPELMSNLVNRMEPHLRDKAVALSKRYQEKYKLSANNFIANEH